MSEITADNAAPARADSRSIDALAAVAAALLACALGWATGFATLADAGSDNDSLLRLVQVRDLLAGQGWFDPTQHRMGLDGGFPMHWSRLVDAPIAALVLIGGETFARVAWPLILFGISLFLVLRIARRLHGDSAFLPALAIGGAALLSIGVYAPGALDHHNVQLTLTLVMLAGLVSAGLASGLAAGCAAALMMAVGAESLPFVAAGGAIAACLFLSRGRADAATAAGYGGGFAGTAALAFVAAVAPSGWSTPACDAFSVAQLLIAVPAGLGLAAAAALPAVQASAAYRALALAGLGAVAVAILLLAVPQCLADPYAGLDSRLKLYWLHGVVEAQSVRDLARGDPVMLVSWYATPALALALLVLHAGRRGWQRNAAIVGALLAVAFLVSLWQVRGAVFAVALAALPLSGWVTRRRAAAAGGGAAASLAMCLAWVLSFNGLWSAAANAVSRSPAGTVSAGAVASACTQAADFAPLAALPVGTVASVSNLGSSVLAHTPHRVLAGPYHRNVSGNLAALDIAMAAPREAQALARQAGVTLVALCPGNSETRMLAEAAPQGLLAALLNGQVPAWLEPVPQAAGQPLQLYRIDPGAGPT